jgi:endonuclease/exonuclease/phosphatase (EEP) superfamily protein YafD
VASWIAVVTVCVAWGIGQLFRDATWFTGLLFYLPTTIVVAVVVVFAGWNRFVCRRSGTRWLLLFVIWPIAWLLFVENHLGDRSITAEPNSVTLRLVHWNVLYGKWGWRSVCEKLAALHADLIVISETPPKFSHDSFPDMHIVRFGTMTAMSRYPLMADENDSDSGGRQMLETLLWRSPQGLVKVLAADFPSQLSLPRHPMLLRLRSRLVANHADLVLGDLNAPRRSRVLSELPVGYTHAYDTVGTGWSSTWPAICPVYALDHCIYGPRIEPLAYTLESTRFSDHRVQIFDFRVR